MDRTNHHCGERHGCC